MFLFFLNSTQKCIIGDLREIGKRIARLLGVKIVHVDEAIFNAIQNHIFTETVVDEVVVDVVEVAVEVAAVAVVVVVAAVVVVVASVVVVVAVGVVVAAIVVVAVVSHLGVA